MSQRIDEFLDNVRRAGYTTSEDSIDKENQVQKYNIVYSASDEKSLQMLKKASEDVMKND